MVWDPWSLLAKTQLAGGAEPEQRGKPSASGHRGERGPDPGRRRKGQGLK